MLSSSRQKIYITAGLLVTVATASVLFNFIQNTQENDSKILPVSISDTNTKRVFIKDFHTYSEYFTSDDQLAIENVLYSYVSQRETIPDLYTGVIEQESFSQKNPRGELITKIQINIKPVDISYTIEATGTAKNRVSPVIIRCLPDEQQKNTSTPCLDGMKRRE